jgi:cytochrome c nitrite reductase small subunit
MRAVIPPRLLALAQHVLELYSIRVWATLAAALGVLGGVGVYTFVYAEGLSYFSSDPRACVNCHIMRDEYDSWRKGSHHAAAVCVDCHLPQSLIPKLLAKADNGYRHSKGFTFQDFHEPIRITPRNEEIVQANCVRCHADVVREMLLLGRGGDAEARCVKCHEQAGHGARW